MFRRHPALTAVLLLLATIGLYLWSKPAAVASSPAASVPAPAKPAPVVAPAYGTCPRSPDGIGKTWMGREISQVMGHPGIGWLERDNREKEEAPSKAIALLELAPDTVIADIGAGSGYYSFRIAPKIPRGRVVAVDIQPEMLDFLKKESARLGIPNVQPHLGAIDDVKLPPASLDAALMVDAYHEFDHPVEMLASLRSALKPKGRIYVLEYREEDPKVPIKPHHKLSEAQARKEFEAAGFRFVLNKPDLPWQHLLIFEKP
jgi:SAM-dependent methyltransferase